jgi:antitoxin PrlF
MESAITSKGQATIPKKIREHLRLKPGDRVKFFVHPDGSVVLLPKLPVSALRGIVVRPQGRPVMVKEMTEAAGADTAEGERLLPRLSVRSVENEQKVFTAMIALKEGRGSFAMRLSAHSAPGQGAPQR